MEILEAIEKRRSIRKYKAGAEISDADIKTILSSAMHAPSACNSRPWEFIVLKSAEAKERAIKHHPAAKHLKDASVGILVCGIPESQTGPAVGYYPQDAGAAIQNILLSSLALGYGTCWCGIYPREDRTKAFKEEFNLCSVPIGMVVIGKADEEPPKRGFYDETKVKVI